MRTQSAPHLVDLKYRITGSTHEHSHVAEKTDGSQSSINSTASASPLTTSTSGASAQVQVPPNEEKDFVQVCRDAFHAIVRLSF